MLGRVVVIALVGCGRIEFDPRVDEPILHFAFDSDGLLLDRSSGQHDATCTACPTGVLGRIGDGAASFDGTKCGHVAVTPELKPSTFTFTAWIRWSTAQNTTALSHPYMGATGVVNSYELTIGANPDQLTTIIYGAAYLQIPTVPGEWHHVASVWNGSTSVMFIDGAYVGQVVGTSVAYDIDDLLIGCDVDNGLEVSKLRGELDDVRLYDHALQAAAIAALAAE